MVIAETDDWRRARSEVVDASPEVFRRLPMREQITLHLRFGLAGEEPMSLEKVGRRLDPPVTRERVRQLEARALAKLRHFDPAKLAEAKRVRDAAFNEAWAVRATAAEEAMDEEGYYASEEVIEEIDDAHEAACDEAKRVFEAANVWGDGSREKAELPQLPD